MSSYLQVDDNQKSMNQVLNSLRQGEVIAYPTESVFGVGCDPDNEQALQKLLDLKQRPIEKGLILIAANYQQLQPYVDQSQLNEQQLKQVLDSWPDAITWIFPANKNISKFLTGKFDSIAVRVTAHPQAKQLCEDFGKPITSTSANLSGLEPCRSVEEVREQFSQTGVTILVGQTGGKTAPSQIRDAKTNQIIREG